MSVADTEREGRSDGGPAQAGPPKAAFRRIVDAVTGVMALLSVVCIVLMLVATVADVIRRAVWGQSVRGVTELGEVAMVAIVFLALGYAQSRNAHVAMTLVVQRMAPAKAALVNGLALLFATGMVGWLLVESTERAIASFQVAEYRFGIVQIPIWPARIVIVVGLAAFLLELVFALWDDYQAYRRGERSRHIEESAQSAGGH